jgi:hypothetical protein
VYITDENAVDFVNVYSSLMMKFMLVVAYVMMVAKLKKLNSHLSLIYIGIVYW